MDVLALSTRRRSEKAFDKIVFIILNGFMNRQKFLKNLYAV